MINIPCAYSKNPILVTGSHRSGTTWVGKILALSPEVGYIQEPFHPRHNMAICNAVFENCFTYICKENEERYY